MKYPVSLVLLVSLLMLIPACSSVQQTTEEEKEKKEEAEVYIFDEVPENETKAPEVTEVLPLPYYIVQIGAFTTKEKADAFALESKTLTENEVEVKYSSSVNLYLVQVKPYFKTRTEAESVRNKLWSTDGYQDAWIITVQ